MKTLRYLLVLLCLATAAFGGVWPRTDNHPVESLDHPTIEEVLARGEVDPRQGFYFVVFGDQRAQANGGWQDLIREINELPADRQPLFILDTGDIVYAGKYSDQFQHLRDCILEPVRHLPYLVGVGNHELQHNKGRTGRQNCAAFLSYLDPEISPDRFWYQKIIGDVRFLFLNSADFAEDDLLEPAPGSRAELQMKWLYGKLGEKAMWRKTIVISHYPFIQTSKSHLEGAAHQWQYGYRGRRMVDAMIDGGVDLVLTGHTHSYERFTLTRPDGRGLRVVNVSGKPHGLWERFFGSDRRARDIRGREMEWLGGKQFANLQGWRITQDELMSRDQEANQFLLMHVDADGRLGGQVHYLDEHSPDGLRRGEIFYVD